MTTVTGRIERPGGDPPPVGTAVHFELVGNRGVRLPQAWNTVDDSIVMGRLTVQTDETGTYTADVAPNADLLPADTKWKRTVALSTSPDAFLLVDAVGGDERRMLSDPPGAIGSAALDLHVARFEAVRPVVVGFDVASSWDDFTEVEVSPDGNVGHTYTRTVAGGRGVIAGTTGGGNDRRIQQLAGFAATDMEARIEFELSTPAVQCGLALRVGDGTALAANTNVIFNASGKINMAHWGWNASTMTTNVGLSSNTLSTGFDDSRPLLAASGNGTTVTFQTKAPHFLAPGDILTIAGMNAAVDGQRTIASVPTATSFTVTLAATGNWTGGRFGDITYIRRRWLAARVVGDRFSAKQWASGEPEPPWGDPNRANTGTIPVGAPAAGGVGIITNHLFNSRVITVAEFQVTSLD